MEELKGPPMLNTEAQTKLNFVIQYLQNTNNPSDAIQELTQRFESRHPNEKEAILINDLFAQTNLAINSESNVAKTFKDPNIVTVETVEITPVPPSSPQAQPEATEIPPEILNPRKLHPGDPSTKIDLVKLPTPVKNDNNKTKENHNVPMETNKPGNSNQEDKTQALENPFQRVIRKTWEPMDVSFTPEKVFVLALKKYQDKNGPALPIPALVNHQKLKRRT
ncbi:hypothetical protein DSO57_1028061 [Entomophthora muscae]|uniref:Uncharacterized protein n=1 Tax=Entomophthora muscae TaxID=34485 RepID=A0ACC2UM77_9FUNG|nr:hypothetical protein DSO57_1028061 [Entomophthora muscae]